MFISELFIYVFLIQIFSLSIHPILIIKMSLFILIVSFKALWMWYTNKLAYLALLCLTWTSDQHIKTLKSALLTRIIWINCVEIVWYCKAFDTSVTSVGQTLKSHRIGCGYLMGDFLNPSTQSRNNSTHKRTIYVFMCWSQVHLNPKDWSERRAAMKLKSNHEVFYSGNSWIKNPKYE